MIKNAVIVGCDIGPERYNGMETEKRGTPEFVVRAHALVEILRNANRWVRGYQSPDTKAKEFGTLLDCVLLTPFQWSKRYAILPDDAPRRPSERQRNAKKQGDSTKEAIAWWDSFLKANPGELISADLNASAHAAANRIKEDSLLQELVDCSAHQVMVVAEWHDKSGIVVPVKSLIDLVPKLGHPIFGNALYDLKTTSNASPRYFRLDAQKYRYDVQGAFYLDLWNAATNEQRTDFGHLLVENYQPYEYRTPPPLMSQRFLDYGRLSYQKALAIYCQGIQIGIWPSYDVAGQWPITDCDDWFLSMSALFEPLQEPVEEEDAETEQEVTP